MRRCLRLQLLLVQNAPISTHVPISTYALYSTLAFAPVSTFVPSPAVQKLFSDFISDSVKKTEKNVSVHGENLITAQTLQSASMPQVGQEGAGNLGRDRLI